MSIADKLLAVNQVKQDIKEAIENKGVDMTDVPFTEYANKIADISGGGGMTYEDYARTLYLAWGKSNQFATAWARSLIVDPSEISATSTSVNIRGRAQYPNGETEGVIIPHGVTSIGIDAFYNWNSNNQPLVIPNSVTTIKSNAFHSWTANNQPLVIPNSVTTIYENAFYNWQANSHPIIIPDSVTSMGANAFRNWYNVPYIEIKRTTPPTLDFINAFSGQNDAPIYVPDASVTAYKTAPNWKNLADRIFSINDK